MDRIPGSFASSVISRSTAGEYTRTLLAAAMSTIARLSLDSSGVAEPRGRESRFYLFRGRAGNVSGDEGSPGGEVRFVATSLMGDRDGGGRRTYRRPGTFRSDRSPLCSIVVALRASASDLRECGRRTLRRRRVQNIPGCWERSMGRRWRRRACGGEVLGGAQRLVGGRHDEVLQHPRRRQGRRPRARMRTSLTSSDPVATTVMMPPPALASTVSTASSLLGLRHLALHLLSLLHHLVVLGVRHGCILLTSRRAALRRRRCPSPAWIRSVKSMVCGARPTRRDRRRLGRGAGHRHEFGVSVRPSAAAMAPARSSPLPASRARASGRSRTARSR